MPAKKKSKTLKLGRQFRNLTFVRESVDVENRTVELSFSSEEPVERWFGMEILGHAPGECDLSRLNNSGAFLMDHNTRDQRGAIESAVIDQKKGRAIIRLSNSVRGEELWQDLKDGIRPHISVGYNILEIIHVKRDENGVDWYRATKWQPYEISSVSVPADTSVGLGRSDDNDDTTDFNIELRELDMAPEDDVLEQEQEQTRVQKPAGKPRQKAPAVAVDEAAVRKLETERCQEIMAMGSQFGMGREAQEAVQNGDAVDKFRQLVLDGVRDKKVKPTGTEMNLGLNDKDVRRYSLINAVRASITGNWKGAGFEREISVALADKMGKDARGFYVNYEVLAQLGRAAQSTSAGMGGELVATDLWSSQFIDLLRPNSIAAGLGVRFATGLVGNVDIPKMTSGASFYWIDEDEDGTESNVALGIIKMSPKTIAGAVPITRRLMQQSTPDIDLLVRDEMLRGIGLGIDKAVFLGTGLNNQPLGIKNQTGVHAIQIPAGGWDWKTIVAFETAVAESNALAANM
ncbi:phage major capsid protein, partial [Shewanella baltica]